MNSAELNSILTELRAHHPPDVMDSSYSKIAEHFRNTGRDHEQLDPQDAIATIQLHRALSEDGAFWTRVYALAGSATVTGAFNRSVATLISQISGRDGTVDWRKYFADIELARVVSGLDDPESVSERGLRLIADRLRFSRPLPLSGTDDSIEVVAIFRICWGGGLGGLHAHPMVLSGLEQFVSAESARAACERAINAICTHLTGKYALPNGRDEAKDGKGGQSQITLGELDAAAIGVDGAASRAQEVQLPDHLACNEITVRRTQNDHETS